MSRIALRRALLAATAPALAALIVAEDARAAGVPFVRGDASGNGRLALDDAVQILTHLFTRQGTPSDPPSLGCEDAADANDDGSLNVTDPILVLNHLYRGGPPPAGPYPDCGEDPTPDALGCGRHLYCRPEFYGIPVEAGSALFVVERSEAMEASGELGNARWEILRNVLSLPPEAQFGIAFISATVVHFPAEWTPAAASLEAKWEAVEFVGDVAGDSGCCFRPALLWAVETASAATATPRAIYCVLAGGATCQGADEATYARDTLAAVKALNTGRIPIHGIGVQSPAPLVEDFLRRLAEDSGGKYVRVDP